MRGEGKGEKKVFIEPRDVWGGPPSLNKKYTRVQHFKKQTSIIFSPNELHENVFPGIDVALDVPGCKCRFLPVSYTHLTLPTKRIV